MSGGHFDYAQYKIDEIIESIEDEVDRATKPKPQKVTGKAIACYNIKSPTCKTWDFRFCFDSIEKYLEYFEKNGYTIEKDEKGHYIAKNPIDEYTVKVYEYTYEEYEDGNYYPEYTEETIEEFRRALEYLRVASIYAHRIDWFLSGDDGEEAFHRRLKEKLNNLNLQKIKLQ